ncbi:MAG TPA: hypothetical protein GXZ48_05585 [Acholeplasmataceae bacterium]|nr:hypothetical protein [Acholeplasmataceae bacterium]
MDVIDVNKFNIEETKEFLSKICNKIDEEVLENASLLVNEDQIVGMMSFECFGNNALIRYFIFKKVIDEVSLLKLFQNVVNKAKNKSIKNILSFIEKEDTIPLFKYLGFFPIDKKYVFIDENSILKTSSRNASVYCYKIT